MMRSTRSGRAHAAFALLLTMLAGSLLAGCSGSSTGPETPPPDGRVVSISMEPAEVSVPTGATRQLAATPRTGAGEIVRDVRIGWTSSDAEIATVDEAGIVTARRAGAATITAAAGGKSVAARVQVVERDPTRPNPAPRVIALLPAGRVEQGGQFVLTVTGSDFTALSEVRWNGRARATTFVSATELRAAIPATDVAVAGTAQITVVTPAPGGGTSAGLTFTISARVASLELRGTLDLWLGEQTALAVLARDPQGTPITDLELTFTSSAPALTVDQSGILAAVTPGRATITVRGGGREATAIARAHAAPAMDLVYTGIGANNNLLVRLTPNRGQEPSVLARPGFTVGQPAVSPDGQRIAFAGRANGNTDIYVINRDGTGLARLTTHGAVDDQPAWSPDGQAIAFRSMRDGRSDVWIMAATGRLAQTLTGGARFGDPQYEQPVFTPDGTRILLTYRENTPGSWQDVVSYSLETGEITALIREPGVRLEEPALSPDGQFLVVRRQAPGETEATLRLYQLTGTPQLQPTSYGPGRAASWSPDGNHLAFSAPSADGQWEHVVVTTPGNPFRKIVATGAHPVWIRR